MRGTLRTAGPVLLGTCLLVALASTLPSGAGVDRSSPGSRGGAGGGGVPLNWTPTFLIAAVPAGGRTSYEMQFVAADRMTDVHITVTPGLAPYLFVAPDAFASIEPGKPVAISIRVTVPEGVAPSTLEGSIRLLRGPKTVARPLPVTLKILEPACDARALLFAKDLEGADDCLQTLLLRDPTDQEANFLRAVTRVLRVLRERAPGPDPASFTDSLQELLDRFGAFREDRDPFGILFSLPSILPQTSPTGGDVQEFLRRVMIPALDGALDDNLRRVGASFSMSVTPQELAGIGVIQSGPVELDRGDVGILAAGLGILRGVYLHVLLAHDLNIDIDSWQRMPPDRFQQEILDRYPALLDLTPDGAANLARAKASYLAAIDDYYAASYFIRWLDDPYQFDDLFAIAPSDRSAEERLRRRLGVARCALLGEHLLRVTDQGAECAAGPPLRDATPTNPAPFFDRPIGLRSLLPPLSFDDECGKEYIDTSALSPAFPFPDPTMNGIFPVMTQEELVHRLNLTSRLEVYPSYGFFMYAPPGSSSSDPGVLYSESRLLASNPRIKSIRLATGTVFSLADLPTIRPGESLPLCRKGSSHGIFFRLNFSPPVAGPFTDTLIIESDDSTPERRVKVFGCGEEIAYIDCDKDGFYDYWDNCPGSFNPSQTDSDGDGLGDLCDNCVSVVNPEQADSERDGVGDACDPCPADPLNDEDGDGLCGGVDICPRDAENDADGDGVCGDRDNCPASANPSQSDADGDGSGDACDTCPFDPAPDPDHDGLCGGADACPFDPENDFDRDGVCGDADNCPHLANVDQRDFDGDGVGDACDDDDDNDQVEDGSDNCRLLPNPAQTDTDADGVGNACDNCPDALNPGQEDRNGDAAGDACQPRIEILDIREDGGATLEVTVLLQDPDGDSLRGTVDFGVVSYTLNDVATHAICAEPLPPEGLPGRGIAFGTLEQQTFLIDADFGAAFFYGSGCEDGAQDYEIGDGSCATGPGYFDYFLFLTGSAFPRTVCVRRLDQTSSFDLQVLAVQGDQATVEWRPNTRAYTNSLLPSGMSLASLVSGRRYQLEITATDGKTPVVKDTRSFVYQGEATIVFLTP